MPWVDWRTLKTGSILTEDLPFGTYLDGARMTLGSSGTWGMSCMFLKLKLAPFYKLFKASLPFRLSGRIKEDGAPPLVGTLLLLVMQPLKQFLGLLQIPRFGGTCGFTPLFSKSIGFVGIFFSIAF